MNADNVELSVIENHSQLTLEQSVYNIISEITSNDFIESLEVVEGSRGFNVNDIVEYETNASVRPIKTIVTSTIDGHVRHTTIPRLDGVEDGNDQTGFTPGDTLVDNDDDTSALSLTVNTVKNGFVTGLKIFDRHYNDGDGFNTIDSNEVFTNGSASIHSQPAAAENGQNLELKITDIKGELASIDIGTASENIKLNDELTISPQTFVYTEQEEHQDAIVTVTSIDVKNIIQHSIGIEEFYPTYNEFFTNVRSILDNINNVTNRKHIHNWVMTTEMYQSYGNNALSINVNPHSGYNITLNLGIISNGGIENFIQNLFNTFPVNSGLRDVTIQMLNMMIDYRPSDAKSDVIKNKLSALGVGENDRNAIDSSYDNDGHLSILQPNQSYNGVPQYKTSLGKTIQFSYGNNTFDVDIKKLLYDNSHFSLSIPNKELGHQFHIYNDSSDSNSMITAKVARIQIPSTTLKANLEPANTDYIYTIGQTIDSVLRGVDAYGDQQDQYFNPIATLIDIEQDKVQFVSDEQYDFNAIGEQITGIRYGDAFENNGSTQKTFDLSVSSITTPLNTMIDYIDLADSSSTFELGQEETITYGGSSFKVYVQNIQIAQNDMQNYIQVKPDAQEVQLGAHSQTLKFSKVNNPNYSNSNNVPEISIDISEIDVAASKIGDIVSYNGSDKIPFNPELFFNGEQLSVLTGPLDVLANEVNHFISHNGSSKIPFNTDLFFNNEQLSVSTEHWTY